MRKLIIAMLLCAMGLAAGDARAVTPIGGAFTLTNQDGKTVTDTDFRGKYMLVFFGFTRCPDLCPTTLLAMSQVLEQMKGDADKVAAIFVTVDPERDTPPEMKKYLGSFNKAITGLTGTRQDIDALQQKYKTYSAKVEDKAAPGGYTFDHSGYISLMDPKGGFLIVFPADSSPKAIAGKIREYMGR